MAVVRFEVPVEPVGDTGFHRPVAHRLIALGEGRSDAEPVPFSTDRRSE